MRYIALVVFICLLPFASFATAPITGTASLCLSGTTTLTDATAGGTWSSSNTAIAAISAAGIVSGIAAGTAAITYTEVGGSAITTVTVYAPPVLTSTLTASICDSATFNYAPASSTPDVLYTWDRPFVSGIYEHAGSGIDNPNEQLINTTYFPVAVAYVYTLAIGGCLNTQTVTLTVNPAIKLSSSLTAEICGGDIFNYTATCSTPGATFAWTRGIVTGITPPTATGVGNISEALTNANPAPSVVRYKYSLTANGCTAKTPETVTLTVYPLPCTLGVVQQNSVIESSVYPNPNTGTFTAYIAGPVKERLVITITNMVGEKVKEVIAETNTVTDISLNVPGGIYMLSASSAQTKFFSKVIVGQR